MIPIGIGVIGAGRMGDSHAQIFSEIPGVKVIGIADSVKERADTLATKYQAISYSDYHQLLDNKDIQAISVCLPHVFHKDCVIAAAQAGKHILCEKPVETSHERIEEMYRACRKANVTLMPGHTHRFYPQNIKAHEYIQSGKIGKPIMAHDLITMLGMKPGYPQWFGKRELAGGGVLMNNGVHSIDRIRYWLGANITSVYSQCGTYSLDIDVEDNGTMFLKLKNGAYATSEISWSTPDPAGTCVARILGSEGAIEIPGFSPFIRYAVKGDTKWQEIPAEGDYGMVAEHKEFIAALRENRTPSVTLEDGYAAVSAILAAYESSKTGKPVTPKVIPAELKP